MPRIRLTAALATVLLLAVPGVAGARQARTAGVASTVNWPNGSDHTVAGDTYRVQSPDKTYSCQQITYDNAVVAYKFELRSGEQWANDVTVHGDGRQRSQLRDLKTQALGADEWVSFAFLWGNSMPTTWVTIFEAHQDAETGEGGKPAPIALQIVDGSLHLYTEADTNATTVTAPPKEDRYSTPLWSSGTWHNVVLHWRLDPTGANGVVELWLDSTLAYSATGTAVGYNDAKGDYFKTGLYRGASTLTTLARFANYEAGTTDLSGRVTDPLPLPA